MQQIMAVVRNPKSYSVKSVDGHVADEFGNIRLEVEKLSSFMIVSTYSDLLQIPINEKLLIVRVLNDENKTLTNTVYYVYPDGVRMWIAATKDN